MRVMLLVAALALTGPTVGCGGSQCSCAAPGEPVLDVTVTGGVPPGGTVEVCDGDTCRTAEGFAPEDDGGGWSAPSGSVPADELGAWREERARPLTITVRRPDGTVVASTEAVAEHHDGCCGGSWSVTDEP